MAAILQRVLGIWTVCSSFQGWLAIEWHCIPLQLADYKGMHVVVPSLPFPQDKLAEQYPSFKIQSCLGLPWSVRAPPGCHCNSSCFWNAFGDFCNYAVRCELVFNFGEKVKTLHCLCCDQPVSNALGAGPYILLKPQPPLCPLGRKSFLYLPFGYPLGWFSRPRCTLLTCHESKVLN